MALGIIFIAAVIFLLVRLFYPFFYTLCSPLRSVPGPFLARFGRLWYFRQLYAGNFHQTNITLHQKYGPVVRVASDQYVIAAPDQAVYGLRSQFAKSDWYDGWKHPSSDLGTLFTDQNIKRHNETRKRFQHMYSMSSLVTYEHYVDVCNDIFVTRLNELCESKQTFDMGHWFQCYAFDVIGAITYSKRFGFLDAGEDVGQNMKMLQTAMVYSTCVGVYPWAHPTLYAFLEKYFPRSGAAARSSFMRFVQDRMDTRKEERAGGDVKVDNQLEEGSGGDGKVVPEDFLNKMLDAHDKDSVKVTNYHVFMMGISNIMAGSDTTAISLSTILYHLIRYPEAMKKLRQEVDEYQSNGENAKEKIRFEVTQKMQYLQACIKEGLRLHPATGLPLWRVVPEGGAEVQGVFFPAGTSIGINTWVPHFDKSVWGADAKVFRPERWIEAEKEGGQRFKTMQEHWMPVRVDLYLNSMPPFIY